MSDKTAEELQIELTKTKEELAEAGKETRDFMTLVQIAEGEAEHAQDELTSMRDEAADWRQKWHDLKYGEMKGLEEKYQIARRIIKSIAQKRNSSFDLRIVHDNGEWEEHRDDMDRDHKEMSDLLCEADRYLTRTSMGEWDAKDVEWLEQFLVEDPLPQQEKEK